MEISACMGCQKLIIRAPQIDLLALCIGLNNQKSISGSQIDFLKIYLNLILTYFLKGNLVPLMVPKGTTAENDT